MRRRPRIGTRHLPGGAALLSLALLASACGGVKAGDPEASSLKALGLTAEDGESRLDQAGPPKRGGSIVYGLEADSNGGFCLAEGQLAISGMMVVRAVYDTLTIPNQAGDFVPYLAKAVTPSEDYKTWTITLREGIKFHDGSALDATVVKNNLDAYRGKYEARSSLLFTFVLSNIDTVEATGPLEVTVTTKVPWVAFPSFLYSSSRLGIMGQKQLDSKNCAKELIGTGPFVFDSWKPNSYFKAHRNENYWQIAPDGKPYPYIDKLEFRTIVDNGNRNDAVEAGDVDVIHTSNVKSILNELLKLTEAGKTNMFVSEETAEVSFLQLNNSIPPFNDPRMRKAMAMAADRNQINLIQNDGGPTIANGPISPGTMGYTVDTGFPAYNKEEAKRLIDEYVAEGGKAEFTLTATPDPSVIELAKTVQQRGREVGVKVKILTRDQAALINDAISGSYEAMTFRNYPGGDPDSLYVWFYSGDRDKSGKLEVPNLVNFARTDDIEMDKLFDEGRSEPDPAKRKEIYTEIDKRMGSNVYGLWTWFTPWAIVTQPDVHNILGPPLPAEDASKPGRTNAEVTDPAQLPNRGLATGHSLIGLWVE